jgi:RNA polymerase sigma-70 factor (ECF subfamily)
MASGEDTVGGAAQHAAIGEKPGDDKEAWEEFFANTYDNLRIAGMLWGRSPEDAEDAANLAMIYVRRRWADIEHPARYAHRIVINYVTTVQKRRREEFAVIVRSGLFVGDRYHDAALCRLEDEQWVRQLLDCLPAGQREVMEAIYEGLSPTEIADLLGRNPATVRKNLQLARARLVDELHRRQQQEAAAATAEARKATR